MRDDGFGDKPEGMSRVQYWAQHLDMANLLAHQEKRAAREAAKERLVSTFRASFSLAAFPYSPA